MKSTGEVMGTGRTFGEAYAKAQAGSGTMLPRSGTVLVSSAPSVTSLAPSTWRAASLPRVSTSSPPMARRGRSKAAGLACRRANKVREGRPHIVDMIKERPRSISS